MTQLSLPNRYVLNRIALGAAMLGDKTAGHPLKSPVTLLEDRDIVLALSPEIGPG